MEVFDEMSILSVMPQEHSFALKRAKQMDTSAIFWRSVGCDNE